MPKQPKHISNPLTIIAVFAGIAEASSMAVLPFISESTQEVFMWFVMGFPILLVLLFFFTLNFNNKALYAPSDFKDEENFFRLTRYDQMAGKEIEMGSQEAMIKAFSDMETLTGTYRSKINYLEGSVNDLQKVIPPRLEDNKLPWSVISSYTYFICSELDYWEFLSEMKKRGYAFESFSVTKDMYPFDSFDTIWLGRNIPVEIVTEIVPIAKEYFKNLQYIYIQNDYKEGAPEAVNNQIFIGGSTETAANMFGVLPMKRNDFEHIGEFNNLESLHVFIRSFYSQDMAEYIQP